MAVLLSACGADEGPNDPTVTAEQTTDRVQVADARFDGDFQVMALQQGGLEVPLISVPVISIETEFGGLSVMPGCNTYFGSFTLEEDGFASFTVAGGSQQECDELGMQEQAVLDVLALVNRWEETADGFVLDAGDGNQLNIVR